MSRTLSDAADGRSSRDGDPGARTGDAPEEASATGPAGVPAEASPADPAEGDASLAVDGEGDGEGEPGRESAGDASGEAAGSESGGGDDDAAAGERGRASSEAKPTPPPLERLEGAVEAMLLAAGEAMSAERIRDLLGLPSVVHVREAIAAVRARFAAAGLSVEVQDVAGGHRVVTRPEYAEYVRRLWRRGAADRLSPTLLETLSIVAYKQPVARVEVERIRGVQCGDALRGLLERRLVKVAGRSDQPGRPLLYATTTRFLEVFGLANLEDLPNAKDLRL